MLSAAAPHAAVDEVLMAAEHQRTILDAHLAR
jgi:hypothetical protein